jgi:hypothetical protein
MPAMGFLHRVLDYVEYLVTLAHLRLLDAICGPEPATPADDQREREQERLRKTFPGVDPG